ncbi:MAG: double-strand break repair protein AddB [Geminicoccaceae bacterium]|nr:double-strand break repair protein AddB [Geminicoccaceae bacterium]
MGKVATIPAHRPFLDTLAGFLLDRGEEALADTLLLLPSRRACVAAREAFLRASAGRTLLLPRLVPIGEPDEAELLLDPEAELDLPPPVPPLRRRLLLARLVHARGDTTHEQAVRLAAELEALLNEFQTEEVGLDAIDGLVSEEFARHWQKVLRFLAILRREWPEVLRAEGVLEPVERRRRLLDALAARWRRRPPTRPIVAAGVTGTIPAVARLLHVIAELPGGLVVLPGLDRGTSRAEREKLRPVHPQWTLLRLLDRLGLSPDAVEELSDPRGPAGAEHRDRGALWRRVMRPAGAEAVEREEPPLPPSALEGLELVEARDLGEEALSIAVRLREALETPGKRAVLVTADRNLARRVASELARWNIAVDDSAGVPLDQTPPGTFLLLTARVLVEDAPPVPLLAALKHPFAQGGIGQREFRRRVRALERVLLRGPRTAGGLEGLRKELSNRPEREWRAPVPKEELVSWLDGIVAAARPALTCAREREVAASALFEAHLSFAEWLARDETGDSGALWKLEAGEAAYAFLAELREALPALGRIPPAAWPALLAVLMAGRAVRRRVPGHPRLAILGRFESRLLSADLVCVGGLVEGVWPEAAESGPWLNRKMRAALGLPPVEQAIGIAAHDFVQVASAPEVVLSWSARDELGQPRAPSRWLVRLEAVLRREEAYARVRAQEERTHWVRRLDEPAGPWPRPAPRPMPRPPAEARPTSLWVTDVRELLRDPYRFYARCILELQPLEPIDATADGALRGRLLHEALALWAHIYADRLPEDVVTALSEIGEGRFSAVRHHPQVLALWLPRFRALAEAYAAWERERRREIARIWAEIEGAARISGPSGSFTICARADRIEIGKDGRLSIIDYKSGALPSRKEVESGREPQLALEAWIAAEGGFRNVPPALPSELVYLSLRARSALDALSVSDASSRRGGRDLSELVREARAGVERLLSHFADPSTAFAPVPRPEVARRGDPFDHLARTAEWWGAESGLGSP